MVPINQSTQSASTHTSSPQAPLHLTQAPTSSQKYPPHQLHLSIITFTHLTNLTHFTIITFTPHPEQRPSPLSRSANEPIDGSRNYVVRSIEQEVSRRKQRTRSSSCPLWSTVRRRQLTWDSCQSDLRHGRTKEKTWGRVVVFGSKRRWRGHWRKVPCQPTGPLYLLVQSHSNSNKGKNKTVGVHITLLLLNPHASNTLNRQALNQAPPNPNCNLFSAHGHQSAGKSFCSR